MTKKSSLICILLLVATTLIFGLLWRYEAEDKSDLRLLAQASAADACEQFSEYMAREEESSYWYGVAAFRTFQQAYYLLSEGTPKALNYTFCNEVYGSLVLSPERSRAHMEELAEIMKILAQNAEDENGFLRMADLRNKLNNT